MQKSKLLGELFISVVLTAFLLSGHAIGAGGKGVLATVLEASDAGCPELPPIVNSEIGLYVAPNGNDAAQGTANAPLATLGRAASLLSKGGTVIVRGGVYPSQTGFVASGSAEVPLHIRAADGEQPIFDGSDLNVESVAVIYMESASHVVIEGLEVRNCLVFGCEGIASDTPVLDLTIRGNHIHHVAASAARFSGRQIRIEDNDIHDVALHNENNTNFPNGGWPTCVGTIPDSLNLSNPWTDDVVIRANRIRDCWGEGIGVWYGSNVTVEDNSIVNAWNAGIYTDNSFNTRIARNYVRMSRDRNGGSGTGVLLGLEDYSIWGLPNVRTSNILVANNVVIAGTGIGWWSMPTPQSTYESLHIFHNSIAGTRGPAIHFSEVAANVKSPANNFIMNNVFLSTIVSKLGNPGASTIAGNAWLNRPVPALSGSADISLEVVFTEELLQQAQVNEAQPLAQLVGKGKAGTGQIDDFLCGERDASDPTRGAFEQF